MEPRFKRGMLPDRWLLIATALYATTAFLYFVAPVFGKFSTMLLGTTPFPYDSVLNAGILEWDLRALFDGRMSVFDWTSGFPLTNTLAGTENLLGWELFYAPVRSAGVSVAGSYNVVILLSLVISGVGMAILSRSLGASRVAATVAGFVFAFYPLHVDHLIHLQTMAVAWSPFAILGLEKTLRDGGWKGPVLLAFAFVMTALCGLYYAVFLPVILFLYAVVSLYLGRYRFEWHIVARIGVAAVVTAIVLSPVLYPYFHFAAVHGAYTHSPAVLIKFSFPVTGLLRTPDWLAVWQHTPLATVASQTGAFPGLVTLALLLASVRRRGVDRGEQAMITLFILLAAFSILLALGPMLTLHTGKPFDPLRWLPLPGKIWLAFTAVRWPTRIILYTVLFFALLAGLGVDRLRLRWPQKDLYVCVIILGLLWVEFRPATWYATQSMVIRDPIDMSDAYPFLARERDRGAVVELPVKYKTGYATPYATRYAYGSAGHLRRVTAFHGSVLPAILDSLRMMSAKLPDSSAREFFVSRGVSRLVVHKELFTNDSGAVLVRSLLTQHYPLLFETKKSAVFGLAR